MKWSHLQFILWKRLEVASLMFFLTQRSAEGYAEERRVFGKKILVNAEVAGNTIWIYLISLERIFNVKF